MTFKLIGYEIKNIVRDRLMLILLLYPLLIGGVGRYLLTLDSISLISVELVNVVGIIISGFLFGAIAGFSILDNRDDFVFTSISISPLSLKMFVWTKIVFIYGLSLVSSIVVVLIAGIHSLSWGQVLVLSLLSGLQVPLHALIINAFASNKVEGFVIMKATGFLMIFPVISYLFVDVKQWLFSIAPGFWLVKATQSILLKPQIDAGLLNLGLNYWGFIVFGFIYFVFLIVLLTWKFNKKIFQ